MTAHLDEQTQQAVRDAFVALDTRGTGRVTEEAFATIMQSFGHAVSEGEAKALVTAGAPGQPSGIECDALLRALANKAKSADGMEAEVLEAFQVFDKDNDGLISVADFRHIMTHMGERFSDAEVDEMIREANVGGGSDIDYRSFTRMLFG
ncbi:Calmodulin [Coemansia spiralis]|nr:Calmodulin [Coemansia spiralis]